MPFLIAGGAVPTGAAPAAGSWRVDALSSVADVYATFCAAALIDAADHRDPSLPAVDGRDLLPVLRGETDEVRESLVLAVDFVSGMVCAVCLLPPP